MSRAAAERRTGGAAAAVPGPAAVRRRRRLLLALVAGSLLAALLAMARVLGGDGLGPADAVLLGCFAATLPWNLLGFWNAAAGLRLLHLHGGEGAAVRVTPALGEPARGPVRARVALLMPVHEEDPARVLRHLSATVASLEATGEGDVFEVFLLSDTQRPDLAAEEAARFARWRRAARRPDRLRYRRRAANTGHKTGNLWEWLETHGGRFDLMVVLDADGVMSGRAILRLVKVMEAHPRIGILQQLVVGLPSPSPFARLFQFGMRHGMRAHAVGAAWWQGDCGPYWGHNAVIRVAPFAAHCRLPVLPGGPPLGGRVLSHDQVEAVLMRRAGYEVRVAAVEDGSYEENPPTLPDFVKRDLRWCQGNWQYLRLLGLPGLHALGRLQLALAILMYVSGPAWILFSLVGLGRAMLPAAGPGPTSGPGPLGAPAAWEGWALLAATTAVVFAPKLAGVAQVLLRAPLRRAHGGAGRVVAASLAELLFSFVLAPIMAVAQTVLVLGMAAGRTIRWEPQLRDSRRLPWAEAWRGLWPQTLLGLALGLAVALRAPPEAWPWAGLFCGPLLLSAPFAVVTSWTGWGRWLARRGIAATPEEIDPPPVVLAAGHGPPRPPRRGRWRGCGRAPPASTPLAPAGGGGARGAVEAPAAPAVD